MKGKVQPDIQKALKPFRFRLRLTNAVLGGCIGMLAAALACVLLAIASYVTPILNLFRYMVWAAAAALAAGILLGFAKPVSILRAAKAADEAGLCERAVTALSIIEDTPMAIIQRADTLRHLRALPPKAALPLRLSSRPLIASGALTLVLAMALMFIPNPQNQVLQRQNAFQKVMAEKAQTVEKAAEEFEKAPYTKEQMNELRKMMGDLALDLRKSREPQQAYLAMDKAQRNLQEFSRQAANETRQAASKAFEQSGMKDLSDALKNGDEQAAAKALSQLASSSATAQSAKNLTEAAESLPEGELKEAAQAAANALDSGNAASVQAAMQSLSNAMQSTSAGTLTGDISALLGQLRAGAQAASAAQGTASGQGQGQGQGNGGQGNNGGQGGQGQGGGPGAGKGSTNQDAGVSKGQQSSGGVGANAPEYKLGQYETIYDPTRLNIGDETHQAAGQMGEGESQQMQLGPGLGDTYGQVPYHQVIYTYQEAASKAADQASLPDTMLKWVDGYFQALID